MYHVENIQSRKYAFGEICNEVENYINEEDEYGFKLVECKWIINEFNAVESCIVITKSN